MKIGVIGLGKLGLCLASVLGSKYKVRGIDKNKHVISEINGGRCPIKEKNLTKWLKRANLGVSTEYSTLSDCKVIFCIVPTPSQKKGGFSNKYVLSAIKSAKPHIKACKLFVIVSTVMPGSCDKFKGLLGINVCYSPLLVAIGEVIDGLINPDLYFIGGKDRGLLKRIYKTIAPTIPIHKMSLVETEIAKISLNVYITTKISFANTLGLIAKKYNVDVNKITNALGTDKRIGKKYFNAGGAYGGPCFPRDNVAFSNFAGKIPNYAKLTDKINIHIAKKVGYFDKRKEYQNILGKDRWKKWK